MKGETITCTKCGQKKPPVEEIFVCGECMEKELEEMPSVKCYICGKEIKPDNETQDEIMITMGNDDWDFCSKVCMKKFLERM